MNRRWTGFSCGVALAAVFFAAGCGKASYPKETLCQSLQDLCQREYHLTGVNAKLAGRTLGIHITVDNLFDGPSNFRKEAADKVDDVRQAVWRAAMSTDAKVDFFNVMVTDRMTSLQVSFVGYVLDTKKAMFGLISRTDYPQRMRLTAVADPFLLGKNRVERIFEYLAGKKLSLSFLSMNFDLIRNNNSSAISSYLLSLVQSHMMEASGNTILGMRARVLSADTMVFYVKAREKYKPEKSVAPAAVPPPVSRPPEAEYEFLIWIRVDNFNAAIDRIFTLTQYDPKTGAVEHHPLPQELADLSGYAQWPERDFFVEDVTFNQFVAEQVAQRVRQGVIQMEDNKLFQKFINIEGKYTDGIEVTFRSKEKAAITQMMIDLTVKTVRDVCRNYHLDQPVVLRIRDRQNSVVFENKGLPAC